MSWVPPYAYTSSYPSWERYDARSHHPSYFESSHQGYVAPKGSTFNKHNQDRFTQKESVRSSWRKKEVVQQVYQVKIYGREDAVSELEVPKPSRLRAGELEKRKMVWIPKNNSQNNGDVPTSVVESSGRGQNEQESTNRVA